MIRFAFFRLLPIVALFMAGLDAFAADEVDYRPNVHGTIRSRFEVATESGDYRFQVRNARVSIDGMVAPSINYYINTDFCDRGKIKILDVWARMRIMQGLSVQAGQFRMPFGVDPFRGPNSYYFANRSFIGKDVCNVRAVGAKLSYDFSEIPLVVEFGAFNPTTIGDHSGWNKSLAFAGKATYTLGNVKLSTGVQSVIPDSIRANLIDGCVSWSANRWMVEGEYMYKHYTNSSHKPCHAYNFFASYYMPIEAGVFNRLSFQGRFDGMTAHSNGKRNDDGVLITDNPPRNRVTVGATISYYRSKNLFVDLRANYECYFYHHDAVTTPDSGDKAVVELVLRF
ncbi:porin [uncultured Muribaculum sp.]|uniref:porin n=1 Tax=uncultured Muribaculum sp. TaxID=1918613 RepID=UPI0026E92D78|nr:porin [uncultured Muribaculum sp.]